MPNVGLWGQLCFGVVQLQEVLQVNQTKLPQTKIITIQKNDQVLLSLQDLQISY